MVFLLSLLELFFLHWDSVLLWGESRPDTDGRYPEEKLPQGGTLTTEASEAAVVVAQS